METLLQDLRFATRTLLREKTATAIAILCLAIGIGATTALFSVIDASMLRALPYLEPDRLVQLYVTVSRRDEPGKRDSLVWSYPKYLTLRQTSADFLRESAVYAARSVNLTGVDDPERVTAEQASASYFPLLGLRAAHGRFFLAEEDSIGGRSDVVVLSHGLWTRRFGADPGLVGRAVQIDKRGYTVVGVAPRGFGGLTGAADLWLPMATAGADNLSERWSHWMYAVGRLAPGVTPDQARRRMAAAGAAVDRAHPVPRAGEGTWGAALQPMRDARTDPLLRRAVLVLFGAVSCVLLIACVNVANLLLARAAGRRREIAVRVALGASRGRLVRQLLTESLLLAAVGGAAGLAVALWGIDVLRALKPATVLGSTGAGRAEFLDFAGTRLDATVLAFAAAVTLGTGLLFGLIPALQSARAELTGSLKDGGMGSLSGGAVMNRGATRVGLRSALVVGEVALALVLLIGAGLMLRSFARLRGIEPGFDARNVLSFRIEPPTDSIYNPRTAPAFKEQMLTRLAALPGVEAATTNSCAPLSARCNGSVVMRIEGRPAFAAGSEPQIGVHAVAPDHFKVLRVPLLRGRAFTARDRVGSPKVVILNQAAARKLFPNEDAIGQRISIGVGYFDWDTHETGEVVGVVGDVQYGAPTDDVRPDAYLPAYAYTRPGGMIMLRTRGDPLALAAAARREIRSMDRDLPIYDVKSLEERTGEAFSRARFGAVLLAAFSAVALLLATMGIYGVMSYVVAQRTREMGLRMALGAERGHVMRLVLRQALALAGAGLVVGLAASLALTRVLDTLLYGVSPTDPATFGMISLVLAAVAAVAGLIPARRATRVDPMVALRSE